ncbi:MAG: hypothetical protein IJX10_06535 [Phascolarctobacterium sp.]|nr:hypothetical protein [Phascolarctobacterium sp.]
MIPVLILWYVPIKVKRKNAWLQKQTNLDFVTDHIGSWPENFDFIFAMTHTEKCGDFFCSAAAIYYADIEQVNDYARNMTCRPFMVIDWYHPWAMKTETVTWMEVIRKLQEIIPCEKKVGIVIDLELGNLEGYNDRIIPVFGTWYFPNNYTFMYATANTSDEWCNKMIRQCDKVASQRLEDIVSSPKLTANPSGGNEPIGFISLYEEKLINEKLQEN